ncbi:MAG TPA: VanZ family protein [Actinomycetales bacterium]|nr:VanZ family protein [Actinomycetales bacterium]
MKRGARAAVVVAYVAYLATVAVLVFDPSQHAPGTSLALVSRVLRAAQLPVPAHSPLEVASNVALFVPFSLLGLLIWPSGRVLGWTAAGALLSTTIELVQLFFLPPGSRRSATSSRTRPERSWEPCWRPACCCRPSGASGGYHLILPDRLFRPRNPRS